MRRRRSRWGADGTDGIDPHNRFTIEPDDEKQKKISCESCDEIFILSDLSESYVCRGCRGLGTREEEAKKRDQLIKKERREIKKEERKEKEKKEEERKKMRKKERKKLTKAIGSSNYIILFEYLVEQRWVFPKLVKEKELIDALLSELKMMRTVKSENFREILEVICSKSGKTKYFRELLPELFLTLFSNYPELLTNADKGFDHWVKYERENILYAINNINNKEFEIIKSMVDQKTIRTMRYTMWRCYGKKKHKYGRDIGLYLEGTIPEKCPSCGNNRDMKSTYRANSWSEYTLKEFDSLLNKRI
ncbi:hypothetical protein OAR30_01965 [Euryarchaeota archaeon]|nr:hypothetical protein [Euryarchaeota archaeon]